MKVLNFKAALKQSQGKRHLLLGNGFSLAFKADLFSYSSLFARADFRSLSKNARRTFDVLNTTNFEEVMNALRKAARLIKLYDNKSKLVTQFEKDADGLREVLVSSIAGNHPSHPGIINEEQFLACRSFLSNFQSLYTINYDLLLYWVVMHEIENGPTLKSDDGFRTPESGQEDYVTWDVENTNQQNVHYLHGALHIFDAGAELQKYTWINTGVRLIDQIRSALKSNLYPLFVAEGKSTQKLDKIQHSGYLSRAFRSFANVGGDLFIFGHSMADSDDHILNLMRKNKISRVFVSLHGDPAKASNKVIRTKIENIAEKRPMTRPLKVFYFDAGSAKVWG